MNYHHYRPGGFAGTIPGPKEEAAFSADNLLSWVKRDSCVLWRKSHLNSQTIDLNELGDLNNSGGTEPLLCTKQFLSSLHFISV